MRKMRFGAMAAIIAVAVGAFLGAQRLALIPGPWSKSKSYGLSAGTGRQAEEFFSAAVADDPADYMGYYRRGVMFEKRREYEKALADFNQAVNLSPTPLSLDALGHRVADSSDPDTHTLGLVFLIRTTRADALQRMNRPEEALLDLDQAIALDASKTEVVYSRGMLRAMTGRYDDAIADFDGILARRDNRDWYFGRGLAKYLKGDWTAAALDLQEAALRAPGDDGYLIWLAKAHLRAGSPLPTRHFASLDKQNGVWPVIEAFMTDHDSAQFISGVKAGAGYTGGGGRDTRCKSALFLGEWLTLHKREAEARGMFAEATELCRPLSIERAAASAELRRAANK